MATSLSSQWESSLQNKTSAQLRAPKNTSQTLLLGAKIFSSMKFSGTVCFYPVSEIENFPKHGIKKSICSIMNSGYGGSIVLGVDFPAIVAGVKISRRQVCVCVFGFINA